MHAGIERAKVVLCSIPDDLLRGIDTKALVKLVRRINPDAKIIANAIHLADWQVLRDAGADIVYLPHQEVAQTILDAFNHAYDQKTEAYGTDQIERLGVPSNRHEIMD